MSSEWLVTVPTRLLQAFTLSARLLQALCIYSLECKKRGKLGGEPYGCYQGVVITRDVTLAWCLPAFPFLLKVAASVRTWEVT